MTFAAVYAKAMKFAAMLQHRHGIAKGDRVGVAMRNYPEWVIAYIAMVHMGAVCIPMNAWWTAEEMGYGIADSGARLVIADEERARRLATLSCSASVITVRTSNEVASQLGFVRAEDELAASPDTMWYLPELLPEDDCTIMYTSGSTGSPKGAVSTHRAQVSSAMNYLVTGLALLELSAKAGAAPADQQVMLLNVPLFLFQEGGDLRAQQTFQTMAKLSRGAWSPFDSASAAQLRELLRAVAVYASGGRQALEHFSASASPAVQRLTQQMRS
jgi:acyl-CoA synthetase (AMP-forming)/AMP-acid ligase II